jgi:hypothetical protein
MRKREREVERQRERDLMNIASKVENKTNILE